MKNCEDSGGKGGRKSIEFLTVNTASYLMSMVKINHYLFFLVRDQLE